MVEVPPPPPPSVQGDPTRLTGRHQGAVTSDVRVVDPCVSDTKGLVLPGTGGPEHTMSHLSGFRSFPLFLSQKGPTETQGSWRGGG